MNFKGNKLTRAAQAGFSLAELLIVIAVIGVMAAIAVPVFANINQNANMVKNRRNAQNVTHVYGAAIAAGATITTESVGAIIDELQTGVPGAAPYTGTTFRINLSEAEQTALETASPALLRVGENGLLSYDG